MSGDHSSVASEADIHMTSEKMDGSQAKNLDASEDRGKPIREWAQLFLNIGAAIAAIFLFLRYDARNRDLTNQLTSLNAQVAAIQRDISGVTLERARIELAGLKATHLEISKTLVSTQLKAAGQEGFKLDFQYGIKNSAAKNVEITNALNEVYVGEITPDGGDAVNINPPGQPGPVHWRSVYRRAHYVHTRWVPGCYIETDDPSATPKAIPAVDGGGGTGNFAPSESSQDGVVLFVAARRADLVAFLVTITIDNETGRTFGIIDNPAHPSAKP